MNTSRKLIGGLSALAMVSALVAGAAETPAQTSTAQAPTWKDKVTANYINQFFGASVASPFSSQQPDSASSLSEGADALTSKNYLSAGYKFTDTVTLSPVLYWMMSPVKGGQAYLRDSYIRLQDAKVYNAGGFNLAADIRLLLPTETSHRGSDGKQSLSSLDKGMLFGARATQIMSYEIPNSRFSFENTTYALTNVLSSPKLNGEGASMKEDLELYVGPQVNFKVSPTVSAFVLYEAAWRHHRGGSMGLYGMDVEPGVSWDITQNVNLSPFLNWNVAPSDNKRLDMVNWNFQLTWKFL